MEEQEREGREEREGIIPPIPLISKSDTITNPYLAKKRKTEPISRYFEIPIPNAEPT